MINIVLVVGCLLFTFVARADDPDLNRLFTDRQLIGTLIIESEEGGERFVHNAERARQRLPVASTFKIFNTLIALQEKVARGKDDVFIWNGQMYDFPDWNRDQTMESAFKVSCVWCYQILAEKIGEEPYRRYLREAEYGQLNEPFNLTTFWLDGSLTISAEEQIRFLRKLVRHELAFSESSYATLATLMTVDSTPHYILRAKTGWASRSQPQIGWYVGYLETPRGRWLFALNIDVAARDDLPLRQQVVRQALQLKGLFN